MAGSTEYTLALKITASATEAVRTVNKLGGDIASKLGTAGSGLGSAFSMVTKIGSAFTGLLGVAYRLGSVLMSAFSTVFSVVGKIASTLMSLPMTGLKLILAGGAAAAGLVYATHKALGPAAEMEKYNMQLDVLGAKDKMPFFQQMEKKSPFGLSEVVQGGIQMQSLGMDPTKYMEPIIDTASMMGKPMQEIIDMLQRARTMGMAGEAIQGAGRIGISRDDLKALGIKFDKSGGVKNQDKLFEAMLQAMNTKFGGGAEKVSGSYEGKVSTLGSAVYMAFAKGLEKALPYATQVVGIVTSMVEVIGAKFAGIDWKGFGDSMVKTVTKATELFSSIDWAGWGQSLVDKAQSLANITGKLFSEEGRTELLGTGKKIWEILSTSLPSLWKAMMIDLKNIFNWGADYISLQIGKSFDSAFEFGKTVLAVGLEHVFIGILQSLKDTFLALIIGLATMLSTIISSIVPKSWMNDEGKKIAGMDWQEKSTYFKDQFSGLFPELPKSTLAIGYEARANSLAADEKRSKLGPGESALKDWGGKTGNGLMEQIKTLGMSSEQKLEYERSKEAEASTEKLRQALANMSNERVVQVLQKIDDKLGAQTTAYESP